MTVAADLLGLDRAHVWHPYAPMPGTLEPLLVTGAAGARLELAGGRDADRRHVQSGGPRSTGTVTRRWTRR